MPACRPVTALALGLVLALPLRAEGWRVESQRGDVVELVPLPAAPGQDTGFRLLCLRDLSGDSRKGLGLADTRGPQVVTQGAEVVCIATAPRPQEVRLWRGQDGALREVLRLSLRAEDLQGRGLRIDWLAE
jgi:hypothetical protein